MESDSQTVTVAVDVSGTLGLSHNTNVEKLISKDRSCSSFSSVVQVLFATKDLLEWCCDTNVSLFSHDERARSDIPSVEYALGHMFQKLNGHVGPVPTPDTNALKRALETFVGGPIEKNEDPASVLNFIVHALHFQDTSTDRTDVLRMWSIDMRRTIERFDCPSVDVTYYTMFAFDVATSGKSLRECVLDNFLFRSEPKKGSESRNDNPYTVSDRARIIESVCGLPQTLCITLRRLVTESAPDDVHPEKSVTTIKKTTKNVKFKEILIIGNESDTDKRCRLSGTYRLYAVITHTGTSRIGYFKAYVKRETCWFMVDDKEACPVTWAHVSALHGSDDDTGEIAYMLFYCKV